MDSNQKPKGKESLTKAKRSKEESDAAEAEAKQRQLEADVEEHIQRMGVCYYPHSSAWTAKTIR